MDSYRTVMMIQQGARRDYIYARQLEEAGLLHSLLTDAALSENASVRLLTALSNLAPASVVGKLRRRTIKGVAAKRIRASIAPTIAELSKFFLRQEAVLDVKDEALALRRRSQGFQGVKVVVNYFGNGGSILRRAKQSGSRIVTDFISHPFYWRVVQAERERWPQWESSADTAADRKIYEARVEYLLWLSDVYLCPSKAVAEGLSHFCGFDPSRVRVVPYGYSGGTVCAPSACVGRVLFAASAVTITKGLPYLAAAATILRSEGFPVEIVVAGSVPARILHRPEVRNLTFLGQLSQKAMAEELAKADIYCLPSLAEGSATSIFEAMACGLPIVTTASAGSVVEHGVEGYIVRERSAEDIVVSIRNIVSDRHLRDQMSHASKAAAQKFSAEACGAEFIEVIRELL